MTVCWVQIQRLLNFFFCSVLPFFFPSSSSTSSCAGGSSSSGWMELAGWNPKRRRPFHYLPYHGINTSFQRLISLTVATSLEFENQIWVICNFPYHALVENVWKIFILCVKFRTENEKFASSLLETEGGCVLKVVVPFHFFLLNGLINSSFFFFIIVFLYNDFIRNYYCTAPELL